MFTATISPSVSKPNCYKCQYRGRIPGDCHSRCNHPKVTQDENLIGALMDLLDMKTKRVRKELGIVGNSYGIKMGWFLWPANFDPCWLIECNGFMPK